MESESETRAGSLADLRIRSQSLRETEDADHQCRQHECSDAAKRLFGLVLFPALSAAAFIGCADTSTRSPHVENLKCREHPDREANERMRANVYSRDEDLRMGIFAAIVDVPIWSAMIPREERKPM